MIRTKQVVINRIAGAMLNTVKSSMICSVELRPSGLVHTGGPAVRKLVSSSGGCRDSGSDSCPTAEAVVYMPAS